MPASPRRGPLSTTCAELDVHARMSAELHQLYGERAQLVEVRRATDEEEAQYLRGEEPKNRICPTGRHGPVSGAT